MASLPLEIWFIIVDHLPRHDQLRISRVSPQLCSVARQVIYREVTLRSDNRAVMATLALLARDYSVARIVQQLHIHTVPKAAKEPAWFNTNAFTGMVNLHRLDLTRMPFCTKEDQLKFNNTVSESLPVLRQLNYLAQYSEFDTLLRPDSETHVPVLQISGLREITWSDPDTFIHPFPILTPIHTSRETLTHICIPVATSYPTTHEYLTQFFTLRFPCLSSLYLGGRNNITFVNAALTRFLIAHPLIEDLHLHLLGPSRNGMHCHVSPDVALGPGTLPNLRRLTADAFNVNIFARSGMSSLNSLETLHTGPGNSDEKELGVCFAEMCQALEARGGLPGLRTLELKLTGLGDQLKNERWISGFGKLCPNVERFWGDAEVGRRAITNPDIFASYANLKSQMIPDMGFDDDDPVHRNLVKKIATCNSSVTNLQFYSLHRVHVINFDFRVGRDAEGRITAMVEVLDNGTEIIWN